MGALAKYGPAGLLVLASFWYRACASLVRRARACLVHMHRSWVRAADSAQFGAWQRVVLPVSGAAVPSVCTVGPLFASWLSGAQTPVRELIDRAMDQREMELTPRV